MEHRLLWELEGVRDRWLAVDSVP
jgi:hypothetical protein